MPDLGAFYGQNNGCGAGIFPVVDGGGIRHQGSPGRRKCLFWACFSGCHGAWMGFLWEIRTSAVRSDFLIRKKGAVFDVGGRSALTLAAVQAWRIWGSFPGSGAVTLREYRGRQPSVRGTGAQQPCWGQGATPIGGLRAAVLIGSRVKRLAQLELMPASTRTGYYLTQVPQVRQLRSPSASRGILKKEGGFGIETDTAQRTFRQKRHVQPTPQ